MDGADRIMGKIDPQYLKQLLAQRGARLEVSEPFRIGSSGRYLCLGKVVGAPSRFVGLERSADVAGLEPPEVTQTLCVVSEEGTTPEEAIHLLLERIARVHRLETIPPRARPRRGWLGRLISAFSAAGAPRSE